MVQGLRNTFSTVFACSQRSWSHKWEFTSCHVFVLCFPTSFFFAGCEWLCAIRMQHPVLCFNVLVGDISPVCVYIYTYTQMDLLNCCLAEHCKLMWTFVFLSLCTDLALTAFNHPSSDSVQTTAVGFFFPNCGVHTFLLLLFIVFGEVVVRDSIKHSW